MFLSLGVIDMCLDKCLEEVPRCSAGVQHCKCMGLCVVVCALLRRAVVETRLLTASVDDSTVLRASDQARQTGDRVTPELIT